MLKPEAQTVIRKVEGPFLSNSRFTCKIITVKHCNYGVHNKIALQTVRAKLKYCILIDLGKGFLSLFFFVPLRSKWLDTIDYLSKCVMIIFSLDNYFSWLNATINNYKTIKKWLKMTIWVTGVWRRTVVHQQQDSSHPDSSHRPCKSPRTLVTQMIIFNQDVFLLGSIHFLNEKLPKQWGNYNHAV